MQTDSLTVEDFHREARRRLIDSHDLMLALGLRSKQALQGRVLRGSLPKPLLSIPSTVTLWDADEVLEKTGIAVTPTDRKED